MDDLEKWETRDPLQVAIRREQRSCKGCRYLEVVNIFRLKEQVCMLGTKTLLKCSRYREKK